MNKKELVATLAERTSLSQAQCQTIISTIFDANEGIIAAALSGDDKVSLPGFGTFEAKKRAARKGTNPATGAKINIPARTVPTFRAGKTLKEQVAG